MAASGAASTAKEEVPSLDKLDPTQRAFVELGLRWQAGHRKHFRALLLGTAGSGKTTTLKSLLKELRARGLQRVIVGAYTGVAASNIGLGARTLTDLFRLAKVNNTSGELAPLEGDDLKDFVDDLGDVELLVIDEISMVSRVMLAARLFSKHKKRNGLKCSPPVLRPVEYSVTVYAFGFVRLSL